MNHRFSKLLVFAMTALMLPIFAVAQEGPLEKKDPPPPLTVDEIIQRFAAKEKTFKEARENYTYTQDVKVDTIDDGQVSGEFRQVTDITFDGQGNRVEHVVFAPQSSLQEISMTREDFADIEKRMPFVLTSDEIPEYSILYVGQQQEDELHTYVFDIAPKKIEKNKRYFQGRIWVDDHDFQIVKTHGKNVPDIGTGKHGGQENLFPEFTTWRQQIDGKYWFPTYTLVDDVLHFRNQDVHVKQVVKYENYKRFGSNVKITYDGQDIKPGQAPPANGQPPAGQPPATPPPAVPK
jgi:hypothetical protein